MQHAYGQYGTRQLTINKLLIQVTGTYNNQWARPFEAQINGDLINVVSEQVASARSVSAALFSSGQAATMIQPSAVPERPIIIPNGWGTERLRFMLQLRREDQMGTIQFINVSGFTDYADLSMNGHIDPRTRFFINSINLTSPTTVRTPFGSTEQQRIVRTDQLVVNRDFQPILSASGAKNVFSIAPDNVFTHLQAEDYASASDNNDLLDTRHHITGVPRLMQRQHNSAPQYCASIMDTWRNCSRASEYSMSNTQLMDECSQMLKADLAQTNPFIDFLMKRMRNEHGYMTTFDGSFSYDDLMALDQNVQYVKQMVPMMGGMHQLGQTASWESADGLTMAASTLAQSVPSYMSALGFNVFHFTASNNTIGSQIVVVPTSAAGFNSQADQTRELEALCFKIKAEVLTNITYGNQVSFNLDMRVDVFGETWIELAMNGQAPVCYVMPTFADALAVPTVTIDEQRLANISYDIKSVFENVWEKSIATGGAPNLTGNIRI